MKIAIIGGGASGIVTAYLLNKNGHEVTILEKEAILGGHIRTLNKNVTPNQSECDKILECGVLEFPRAFHNFLKLMQELEIELEPVNIGSALFLQDGRHLLSALMIEKNFTGIQRLIAYFKLNTLYGAAAKLWLQTHFIPKQNLVNQPICQYLPHQCLRNDWLKLLVMYSYSMPFELIDNCPVELVIPTLRDYIFVKWVRIKGGVYSYIEKILERFQGKIWLNVKIAGIIRQKNAVQIRLSDGVTHLFDKVVLATPPDQVMKLLSDPTNEEIKRFSAWQKNQAKTVIHTDTSIYTKHGIKQGAEFGFFQTKQGWGYNAYLNQLCGISSPPEYSLAFNLDNVIAKDKILHIQEHHTPLYTVDSFKYRNEIIISNGENNTYHAGAYLGDGLHEGAITSAMRVSELIRNS
ncbi:FAD-dependent oxidoreductase [Nodularia sphaerocarpa]|uniref:FAD-dependent oxidoreductase n=1 Tax=Nodularia sphaerocarpa TaxID=137816 RepID=UPI001EFBA703|nr:FAD-dependent oxidoreductase [Nodularia sphaerocarpa]MDB9372022.1 FAD-dependent oxidoreductase [Nodularia sphaerocarpa CS-585]MDB9378581.1 FAD-dependent oxidoreductase [Nodularia sphaerocarpa CS-585A2]ULP73583.1 Putative thiazole biosynthetic enzyme [Nodularia sphaerocarpa UHCC 0038]